jgi:hypothetical protein
VADTLILFHFWFRGFCHPSLSSTTPIQHPLDGQYQCSRQYIPSPHLAARCVLIYCPTAPPPRSPSPTLKGRRKRNHQTRSPDISHRTPRRVSFRIQGARRCKDSHPVARRSQRGRSQQKGARSPLSRSRWLTSLRLGPSRKASRWQRQGRDGRQAPSFRLHRHPRTARPSRSWKKPGRSPRRQCRHCSRTPNPLLTYDTCLRQQQTAHPRRTSARRRRR